MIFCILFIVFADRIEDPTLFFYNPKAIIYFIVGGIIGIHYFDEFTKKSSKSQQLVSLAIFVTLTLVYSALDIMKLDYSNSVKIVLYGTSALSFWKLSDLFIDKLKDRKFYTFSFAVYAMHVNVQAVICKIFYLFMPKNELYAIPNFIFTVVFTLLSINTFCFLLNKYMPKTYRVLMGANR